MKKLGLAEIEPRNLPQVSQLVSVSGGEPDPEAHIPARSDLLPQIFRVCLRL